MSTGGKADYCRNGHDRNILGRTPKGKCRACEQERDRNARRRKPCVHPGPCEIHYSTTGARRCRVRNRIIAQKGGQANGDLRRTFVAEQPPDGWEDEFGPVPLRVPEARWYDRVAVERFLTGEKQTRDLTPMERRAVDLLAALRGKEPTIW